MKIRFIPWDQTEPVEVEFLNWDTPELARVRNGQYIYQVNMRMQGAAIVKEDGDE